MTERTYESDQPIREYLEEPQLPSQVIESELRTGGRGLMLRENIIDGLGAIYGHTPFAQSLLDCAEALDTARQYEAYQKQWPFVDLDDEREKAFYSGALLALHAGVSIETPRVRRAVLNSQMLARVVEGETFSQTEHRRVADLLKCSQYRYRWFDAQSTELQGVIVDATTRAYGTSDKSATEICQHEMVFGCMYTFSAIEHIQNLMVAPR